MNTPKITSLYLYLTFMCNLKCKHCWAEGGDIEEINVLTSNRIIELVENAMDYGLEHIKFSGGEPFIKNNQICEVIKHVQKKHLNLRVSFETNALLVDKEILQIAKEIDSFFAVSLHSADAKVFNDFVQSHNAFERVVNNLKLFRDMPDKELMIAIGSFNNKKNDLKRIIELGIDNGFRKFKFNPIIQVGRGEGFTDVLKDEELLVLVDDAKELIREYEGIQIKTSMPLCFDTLKNMSLKNYVSTSGCGFLNTLCLLPNGDLSLCAWSKHEGNESLIVGSINSNSFDDLINNITDMRSKVYPLSGVCSKCILVKTCKGSCRAMAHAQYGELNAPNPVCQSLYEKGLFPKSRLKEDVI